MNILRLLKVFTAPLNMLHAALYPVSYAKRIGVGINGQLTIYGSSYEMFSTEPYLVTLGDNVFISIKAKFVCHDGSALPFRKNIPDLELAGEITVGNNVFIGMGALILPNIRIGNDCIIGANAVVTKDVADGTIVAGNPARVVSLTKDFLERAQAKSLKIGDLVGKEKVLAYKKIFNKI
ncbi:acyltransferase [Pseudomonas fluorescens]|jgi:acetyltransferase-like isoleucine patch superfamily enzyme|uniref:acyltransferase n=1 Tax=Pseudomonas fluorescens TaxID=294 RepID=UPI0010D9C1E8|nr:acyltransferase [Pseudomonas fluorescens]TCV55901.1 transferase family hexapeptide repeat protein [Pseudomonas fluorescens]